MRVLSRSLMLALSRRPAARLAARRITTSTPAKTVETTVSGDAVELGRLLRKDTVLLVLVASFGALFGYTQYSIFHASSAQPRDIVGLPKPLETGYECSSFERPKGI